MTETRAGRPPALQVACLYLGGIFAIQLVRALVVVVGVSSPDGQDDVKRQIGWFRTDGASFADAVSIYRIVLTIVVILAASGVVFAVYAARGHHPSRILLTVLAVVFLGAGVGGLAGDDFFSGVLGFVGVVFAAQLWTPVVRSWFRVRAGKDPLPVKAPPAASVVPAADPFAQRPAPAVEQQAGWPAAPPPPPPGHPQPYARPGVAVRQPLPKPVAIAAWTAMIGSIVVGGASAVVLLGLAVIGNDYEKVVSEGGMTSDLIRDSGIDYDTMYTASLAIFSVCLVLSIGGLVGASLVLARKAAGHVVLFVMTVVTLIVSVLFFPVGLPWTAAAIVVLLQLRKPEAKSWFVRT